MREVRMSARQLAALTGEKQTETPKVTQKRVRKGAQASKSVPAHKSAPCVGKRYRVARGLDVHFTTPPPVNSVCHVWFVGKSAAWLDCFPPDSGAEIRLLVSEDVLRDYFTEVAEEETTDKQYRQMTIDDFTQETIDCFAGNAELLTEEGP